MTKVIDDDLDDDLLNEELKDGDFLDPGLTDEYGHLLDTTEYGRKTYYLGNSNLKRAGTETEFTKEQKEELMKCADPKTGCEYFIRNYVKIVTVDDGLVMFDPYDFQLEIADKCVNNRFVICKLPRQSGKTTIVAAILMWFAIFHEKQNIALLANKSAQSRVILARIQIAYQNLPKWLQQGIVEWNKGNIELENGSKIIAASTSSDSIRGDSFNLIYMDELAFVSPHIQEDFFASIYPTITSGKTSKMFITSTPKGMEMFYKIWTESQNGKNDFVGVEVNWYDIPGRDEEFKRLTIANTSEAQWRVEFECEFLGSSETLISGPALARLVYKDPIPGMSNDKLSIYEPPKGNRQYVMCVDVARGVNKDYSAFVVIDISDVPYNIVATFRSNQVTPQQFPNHIFEVGRRYNEAYVMVEINDIGQQVADILHENLEYEGLVWTSFKGRNGVQISSGFGGQSIVNGLRTTLKTKKIGCANLQTLVESQSLYIPDFWVINELSTFVASGSSYAAQHGKTDDLAMCLVMFGWMATQNWLKEISETDYVKTLSEKEESEYDSLLPFGFINDGHTEWDDDGYVL